MRTIKLLAEQIEDEVEGACEYAKDALEYKARNPELAELYHKLARTEYEHTEQLHEMAVREIKAAEDSGVTVPAKMLNKWDEKHAELIEKMADAKLYMDMW